MQSAYAPNLPINLSFQPVLVQDNKNLWPLWPRTSRHCPFMLTCTLCWSRKSQLKMHTWSIRLAPVVDTGTLVSYLINSQHQIFSSGFRWRNMDGGARTLYQGWASTMPPVVCSVPMLISNRDDFYTVRLCALIPLLLHLSSYTSKAQLNIDFGVWPSSVVSAPACCKRGVFPAPREGYCDKT